MHLSEKLFSVGVNETYAAEIDEDALRRIVGSQRVPAFLKLADALAGELAFNDKPLTV